jgi:hypothetical protein
MSENATATRPIVIDAAAINRRSSSPRKARKTSSAVGCIREYNTGLEKDHRLAIPH